MQQLENIAHDIFADLARQPGPEMRPLHLWDPPNRGLLDMRIKSNGSWFYQGGEIQRGALVKLFASILRKEADGKYYLVTPQEKFQISVDDAPFIIVDAEVNTVDDVQNVYLRTNVEDYLVLDAEHPLEMRDNRPYVKIRDELWALIGRNVFYRLVGNAEERTINGVQHMVLRSAQSEFSIGELS
ncbi:MAG: DUF1285 domain-containing protein [Pseudomonadales bacterium]